MDKTLFVGEVGIKERVKMIMDYRKPTVWIIVLAFIACVAVAVCFLTNPKSDSANVTTWFDLMESGWSGEAYTIELPEFPGVTFKYFQDQLTVTVKSQGNEISKPKELELVDGLPAAIIRAYFCDFTGDGFPELCSEVWAGSGIIDSRIIVYDHANGELYELEDRGYHDYFLRLDDDCLYVDKKYYDNSNAVVASGRLILKDGVLGIE